VTGGVNGDQGCIMHMQPPCWGSCLLDRKTHRLLWALNIRSVLSLTYTTRGLDGVQFGIF